MERYFYKCETPIDLEAGGVLEDLEICYYSSHPFAQGRKVIWVTHALTANADPSEWWDTLVGPGLFFDTDRYFVICANMLGSCYGTRAVWKPFSSRSARETSGEPLSVGPTDPLSDAFPIITFRDMVIAHEALRKHLGIEKIDLIVGGSSGGFQALEWVIMNPDLIERACFLAMNARVSPCCTAWEESQRMVLRADSSFVGHCREVAERRNDGIPIGGNAALDDGAVPYGTAGLAAARSIGLISYRSYSGYELTQFEKDADVLMARRAVTYQQYQGEKLVRRFDPFSYYLIANTVDTHNVGRGRGGVEKALSGIKARVLCIGIDSDGLFPPEENRFLADCCTGTESEYVTISSSFGHDGFLLEHAQISAAISKWCPWLSRTL